MSLKPYISQTHLPRNMKVPSYLSPHLNYINSSQQKLPIFPPFQQIAAFEKEELVVGNYFWGRYQNDNFLNNYFEILTIVL